MTQVRLNLTAVQVRSVKPNLAYGVPASLRLDSGKDEVLLRATMPASVPSNAVVTSASLVVTQKAALTGSRTLTVQRNATKVTDRKTWATRPALTGTAATLAQTATAAGALWSLNVATDVQAFVSGTASNFGWRLSTSDTVAHTFYGSTAASGQPYLLVDYLVPADVPTDLNPSGGAVSVNKPTLTFTGDEDMTHLQVQIDPAANGTTPGFDSGEVAATAGVLALTATFPRTASVTTTNLSTGITAATATFETADVGATITGTGIPNGATIASVQSGTAATLSAAATATGTVTATITRSYAGLANTASTQWRARVRNPLGLSAWSEWVTFSRTDLPALTITAPGSTTADGTPPVTWTFTGQTAWRAWLRNSVGTVLADSGPQVGTAQAWTPPKGLTVNGQVGTVEVWAFDGVVREATPGAPVYKSATATTTFTLSGAVGAVDTLTATQDGTSPGVVLSGTRAAGIPDELAIYRDGSLVAQVAGTSVFTGTSYSITDHTAPMNRSATWRVAPVVNGATASGGPTATMTPRCRGIWLTDPDTGTKAVVWGDEDAGWEGRDVAITHTPVGPNAEVSRRRLLRLPRAGVVAGPVLDVGTFTADSTITALDTFADSDAGRIYRLVLGDLNLPVIVGDVRCDPTPLDGTERIYEASFAWWARR